MIRFSTLFLLVFGSFVHSQKILAVLDFDYTLVDANSVSIFEDIVPKHLRPKSTRQLYRLQKSFLPYMNLFYNKMHKLNITPKAIIDLIQKVPAVHGMDKLVDHLYCNKCDVIIISNSYTIFIMKWLQANSLLNSVNNIYSNPSWFDKRGKLNIKGYHNQTLCKISPSNLCKRSVLLRFINDQRYRDINYDRIIYVGDGKNDLCAVRALKEQDLVFARAGFQLIQKVSTDYFVKAKVFGWSEGTDIIRIVRQQLSFNIIECDQLSTENQTSYNSTQLFAGLNLQNCMIEIP